MGLPEKQTAWVYKEYGPKENLSLSSDIPVEIPTEIQVLMKVHAAALNPVDFKRRNGIFRANESLPTVPGHDVAGVVVQVGAKATKFKVGDRVYGDVTEHVAASPKQYGSLAQYVAVDEKLLDVIPERLSFVEAASLPLALLTAYQALQLAGLKEGQTVLILGGAGGVGTLAVQLAKHVFKASLVASTASGPKVGFVKSLGADVVIDYKEESFEDHGTKYDVVFDTVGSNDGPKAVKNGGFVVLINQAESPAEHFTLEQYLLTSSGADLKKLSPLFEDGTLKPIVDSKSPFKFDDAVEAFGYLETGRAVGKIVIAPIE